MAKRLGLILILFLSVSVKSATVSGQVIDTNGLPVSHAIVEAYNSKVGRSFVYSNPFGFYSLELPTNNNYVILAYCKRGSAFPVYIFLTEDYQYIFVIQE